MASSLLVRVMLYAAGLDMSKRIMWFCMYIKSTTALTSLGTIDSSPNNFLHVTQEDGTD